MMDTYIDEGLKHSILRDSPVEFEFAGTEESKALYDAIMRGMK
jgi:hypothetical protein